MRRRWVNDMADDRPDPAVAMEERLFRHARRLGFMLTNREAEDAAAAMLAARRDPLERPNGCIFMRHGRPCPGEVRGHCSLSCDIPF